MPTSSARISSAAVVSTASATTPRSRMRATQSASAVASRRTTVRDGSIGGQRHRLARRPASPAPAAAAALGVDRRRLDAELRRHPAGEAAELHLAEPRRAASRASGSRTSSASSGSSSGTSRLSVTRSREMRICSAWPSSTSRRFGCRISPARASSVSRSPYSLDELRRGLDADAGRAGHVVDRVAGERLHVDHPVGADAELLDHLVRPDRLVLQGVEHLDAGGDELHQVLVGARRWSPARRPPRAWVA